MPSARRPRWWTPLTTLCGASGIFQSNPIQRRFQDIHVITQHVQGHHVHYETAGQYLLGLEPQGVF